MRVSLILLISLHCPTGHRPLTAPERKKKGKVSSLRETSNQDTEDNQSEERDKLNPYRLTYGELSEEDEPDDFVYLELTKADEDIEVLRPGTSKSNVTQTKDNTVQTQDPEVDQKGQESQNSGNKQETGDPEEVERDRETNSVQELDKESEPESGQESEQGSEPKLNKPLSEEESIPSSESDNHGEMAQPPAPPAVERGPSIRLPWFTGKEDEQVEKYFRELKRLKAIYKWQDDHLLNMRLLGLKGRVDDWASALDDADKDTFLGINGRNGRNTLILVIFFFFFFFWFLYRRSSAILSWSSTYVLSWITGAS